MGMPGRWTFATVLGADPRCDAQTRRKSTHAGTHHWKKLKILKINHFEGIPTGYSLQLAAQPDSSAVWNVEFQILKRLEFPESVVWIPEIKKILKNSKKNDCWPSKRSFWSVDKFVNN